MQFDDFLSVIDLLKDTTKYEAKVTELKTREKAIQDSIKQLGVVGDIAKAKSKAEALVVEATEQVEAAKKEAEGIVAISRTVYDKRHTELKEREVVAEQAISDYNSIKAQFTSRDNELRAKEKEVEATRAFLQKQQDELAVKQLEVDERLTKLRQVMG